MKFSSFIKHLTFLGFPEKEARVYLACLETGSASVAVIAEKAAVKRSTAYVMLKSLAARGLIQPAASGKKSDVVALAPARVLELFEEEKRAAERKHGFFSTILPDLEAAVSTLGAVKNLVPEMADARETVNE